MDSSLASMQAAFSDRYAPCHLCGQTSGLAVSHIVPAFVYRWLKETSATGYFRDLENPNLRLQDGIKCYMLCSRCEQLFSSYEQKFAETVFHPLNLDSSTSIAYEEWLIKFATSVSWRVLRFLSIGDRRNAEFSESVRHIYESAEKRWRDYLLGKVENPAEYEQHILVLDYVSELPSGTKDLDRLNAYLMRSVHVSAIFEDDASVVYSKMGKYLILGNLSKPQRKLWAGTKIALRSGILKPRTVGVPGSVLGRLLNTASAIPAASNVLSQKQNDVIERDLFKDIDRTGRSGSFAAMSADAVMTGEVRQPKPK